LAEKQSRSEQIVCTKLLPIRTVLLEHLLIGRDGGFHYFPAYRASVVTGNGIVLGKRRLVTSKQVEGAGRFPGNSQ